MDIQAYFEEWSRQPGDVVRLAISTPHKTVRATLVRLVSGPGQGDHVEGQVEDFSSVLDKTVPGRLQSTMIGSCAEFPLPAPIKNDAISLHCWIWPTVPERETPQAIWSLGDLALVIVSGSLELRTGNQRLVTIADALIARHWYSVLVTLGNGEASIDLKRLDGKGGATAAQRFDMGFGVRDVEEAPDGSIWVSEGGQNNTAPGALYRLTPK